MVGCRLFKKIDGVRVFGRLERLTRVSDASGISSSLAYPVEGYLSEPGGI